MRDSKEIVDNAATNYEASTLTRAAVQLIPGIGGSLDTLLSSKGVRLQQERLHSFIRELSERMKSLENQSAISEEDLWDLSMDAISKAVKTRSEEKRALFAEILAKHVTSSAPYDEAATALRIMGELDPIHVKVLKEVLSSSMVTEGMFAGLQVVLIRPLSSEKESELRGRPVLAELIGGHTIEAIYLAVAELIAKGLLYDEGIGRWGGRPMEEVIPTDSAKWFVKWIT